VLAGGWRLAAGGWRLAAGGWRLAAGGWRLLHRANCCRRRGAWCSQVSFKVDDPAFKLDDLLALELHKFEDEVGEIVDRAQKEEKMEAGLRKLEDAWAKVSFQFAQHKDTPVYTVKMAEEDFEVGARGRVSVYAQRLIVLATLSLLPPSACTTATHSLCVCLATL
jgi:hypothetical protein